MTLQALLVSKDDQASETLSRALAGFGIAVERSSDPEVAISRLGEQRFDEVIVDFEDEAAAQVLDCVRNLSAGRTVATVALVNDEQQIRSTFGAGANFVVVRPVSDEKAVATLRAATALLKRERRRAFRVPVQAPVSVSVPGGQEMEGIMLDLSETGMDVLVAQPLVPPSLIAFRFTLPDGSLNVEAHGEVAWANPNGQSGVHFLDVPDEVKAQLREWLSANAAAPEEAEPVSHCKLTDLSLGGCYVGTESPFPERALVDLCLRAGDMEIHAQGLVRVMHPSHGMGIEFPSRTSEQRATVEEFINFLTSQPGTMPELLISPQKMVADLAEFPTDNQTSDESSDPLLELLRNGHDLTCEDFANELRKQRSSEEVASK